MQPLENDFFDTNEGCKNIQQILFPEGLPGLENVKEFLLIAEEEETPFVWLQAAHNPETSFLTVDPFIIHPSYLPDISEEDLQAVNIGDLSDVFLTCIVNMRNNHEQGVTVNLVSPILINWKSKVGKQVILQNYQDYSVRYRIDQAPKSA
ncbi:MAG: fliW [Chlamydiales bacterium]|jgi:flagellar assembly factor FliW|nr:fliW [Chlamydiales bacterium]